MQAQQTLFFISLVLKLVKFLISFTVFSIFNNFAQQIILIFQHYSYDYYLMQIKIKKEELTTESIQNHRYSSYSRVTSNPHLTTEQQNISSNSILAIKILKEKQDALDSLKKRLSVLKIHEQKSLNKFKTNKKKMEDHQYTRALFEEDQTLKQKYLKQLQENISKSKNFNNHQRKVRKDRLQDVHHQIYQMKHAQYNDIRQMSQFIDRNIKIKKFEDLSQKKDRRNHVVSFEKKHRQNLQKYFQSRIMDLSDQKTKEVQKCTQKANQRDRQIQRLSQIQAKLLERQSRSQMIANQSSAKFRKMVMNPQTLEREQKNKNKKLKAVPQQVKNKQHEMLQKEKIEQTLLKVGTQN